MDYSYIKNGAKVRFNDPAINDFEPKDRDEQLNLIWEVFGVSEPITDDYDIVNIKCLGYGGEAEVYACELRYPEDIVRKLVASQISAMIDNNIVKDCGNEPFCGWCEDGEVFGWDDDCIKLMKEVAPLVDKLTYSHFFDGFVADGTEFELSIIENQNTIR